MPTVELSPEIQAIKDAYDALSSLTPRERRAALRWLVSKVNADLEADAS